MDGNLTIDKLVSIQTQWVISACSKRRMELGQPWMRQFLKYGVILNWAGDSRIQPTQSNLDVTWFDFVKAGQAQPVPAVSGIGSVQARSWRTRSISDWQRWISHVGWPNPDWPRAPYPCWSRLILTDSRWSWHVSNNHRIGLVLTELVIDPIHIGLDRLIPANFFKGKLI